jgi:hypothetical protein
MPMNPPRVNVIFLFLLIDVAIIASSFLVVFELISYLY